MEAAQFLFDYKAVMTAMAMAGRQSAVHPLSAPAPAAAELQLILKLLRSLNERMERLERQFSWQHGQTERPEGRRRRGRRRRTGRSQVRCDRCKQPGHFARECRAPTPIGSTGSVVRREAELGGKRVPALADTGVEVSTVRHELGVDPGSSSSTVRQPILPNEPVVPGPAVLPPERTADADHPCCLRDWARVDQSAREARRAISISLTKNAWTGQLGSEMASDRTSLV
ncbi:hypothetical protein EGW08_017281 [Elysia chlorotica]|uniref:CCHC-type domain-containing protein n=1 Tax=Elysia chlorotica TaxID=188477 RepID=A0A433T094_ELYCH|nr:hypothetical protein EGW08_017281 [Elysia chlorotica]